MIKKLLQAKSTDGGQQEDTSGGTGRGDANEDSGGAGRASREEGAAGARVGVTTATATGGRVSNHSRRASDRLRPADNTDRRPEVPVSMDPMINIQSGEARDVFIAGIAAHDGDGVLSSGFQRRFRVV